MRIPLQQFEQVIDPTILKRGLSYYKNGLVDPPEQLSHHELEVIVHGTEDYTVQLHLDANVITDFVCDCPYDDGPVCKHVAAAIFYLQRSEIGLDEPKASTSLKKTATVRPTRGRPKARSQEVIKAPDPVIEVPVKTKPKQKSKSDIAVAQKLMDGLTHEQIKDYFTQEVLADKKQLAAFITAFSAGSDDETKERYAKQIKAILASAGGRGGFIEYRQAIKVGEAVFQMVSKSAEHYVAGQYRSAMLISCAVLEEMVKALGYADDSNGDFGGNAEAAFCVLVDLSQEAIPEELRNELLKYALSHYAKNTFSGWDWHTGMIELATALHRTPEEAQQIRKIIEQTKASDYELQSQQVLIYQLTQTIDGPEAAGVYAENHLDNRHFREMLLREAFDRKDFAGVINLAEDGIRQDLKPAPGLVHMWYDWLIKVARIQHDQAMVVKYARTVILQHAMDPEPYYILLKEWVPSGEWTVFVDDLISEVRSNRNYRLEEFIPHILSGEEAWDKLLAYIRDSNKRAGVDLGLLDEYSTPLAQLYPEEYIRLYREGMKTDAYHLSNRRDYQRHCQQLRRLKKLGFRTQVAEMVATLRRDYPKRAALMEELDGV